MPGMTGQRESEPNGNLLLAVLTAVVAAFRAHLGAHGEVRPGTIFSASASTRRAVSDRSQAELVETYSEVLYPQRWPPD
jgi:hypothetical protein